MSNVIVVENLSKSYQLSHRSKKSRNVQYSLHEAITDKFLRLFNRPEVDSLKEDSHETFWALKNISFEVKQGDRLAIIGKNGAGKSTLLKILSRVVTPSSGTVRYRGRMSSLLEVGTGFHPELTGRENIYLNGAVLGMSQTEVRKKFDAIVDFADVEKFLDTPVKHYSSGMYVRLAFSVSAFLEPDIVVLDEVLSVGDGNFQKKSQKKMREMATEGRTVLFVSHSMAAAQSICNRGMVLENGSTTGVVSVEDAISNYGSWEGEQRLCSEWVNEENSTMDVAHLVRFRLISDLYLPVGPTMSFRDSVWLETELEIDEISRELTVGFALYDEQDTLLFWSFQVDQCESNESPLFMGRAIFRVRLPLEILNNGIVKIKSLIGIYNERWIVDPDDSLGRLRIEIGGTPSDSPFWVTKRPGVIAPRLLWNHSRG